MSALAESPAVRLDFDQVRRILPQKFPLILIDRVTELEPGSRIVALKNVTGNELHFLGHFPEFAVMPGVLIIEAAAQAVIILCSAEENTESLPSRSASPHYLANANMSFRVPVTPGDQMLIEAKVHRRVGNLLVAKIKVAVTGTQVADGELTLVKKSTDSL
jgi:3-hydroxyacyl-[acyl-carrier-protein] dehydratase